jgi:hypothetical protein
VPCQVIRCEKFLGWFLRNGGKEGGLRKYVSSDHPFLFFMSSSVRAMIITRGRQNIAMQFSRDFLKFPFLDVRDPLAGAETQT